MSRRRDLDKILTSKYISIGELARITGTRYSTLKFYTEEGMLDFLQEEENLTRRYDREQSTKRLKDIKDLKALGFNIVQIKEKLANSKLL